MDNNDPVTDPHLFGAMLVTMASQASRMYALITAAQNEMYDLADELMNEAIAEGPDSVKSLIYNLLGSFSGMASLLQEVTGQDQASLVSVLATGNSALLEVGSEIVRICEGEQTS